MFLHDFSASSNNQWQIVDDVVMGGKSSSQFTINEDGHGLFHGNVSTENNGGFSSVRNDFKTKNTSKFANIIIRLKGDGKSYQFRVKSNLSDYYSYIYTFKTSGSWEEIFIPFKDMHPSFRGRKLDMPNFNGLQMQQNTFLIANKVNEEFRLELNWIKLN